MSHQFFRYLGACFRASKGDASRRLPNWRTALPSLLLALTWIAASLLQAAPITFKTPVTVTGESDILNLGTNMFAIRYWGGGTLTLGGVTFGTTVSTTGMGNLGISGATVAYMNGYAASGTAYNALSSNYQQLINGGAYVDGGSLTVTLNGLTSNRSYAVQMWVSDSRGTPLDLMYRQQTLSSSGGNSVLQSFNSQRTTGGVGQYAIGGFVSGSASQSFFVTGTMAAGAGSSVPFCSQINSILLRDISAVWNGSVNGNWDASSLNWGVGNAFSAAPTTTPVYFGDLNGVRDPVGTRVIQIQAAGVSAPAGVVFENSSGAYSLTNLGVAGISGEGGLTKNGSSPLTLSGTHSFAGAVNVNAGSLVLGTAGALPSVPVTVAAGATLDLGGYSQSIGSLINSGSVINSGGTATLGLSWGGTLGSLPLGNVIYDIKFTSPSTVLASALPPLTRALINAGATSSTMTISGNLGSNTQLIQQLSATSPMTLSGTLQIGSSGVTVNQNGGAALSISSATTGSGSLTLNLTGGGALNLTGALGHTGGLFITKSGAGALSISNLASYTGPRTYSAEGTGALTISAAAVGANDLVLKTAGSGLLTVSGDVNISGMVINSGSGNAGNLAAIGAQATQGAAILSGALGSSVTKVIQNSPTSPLVLFAANGSYGGPVEIQSGALVLSNKDTLGFIDFPKVAGTGLITVGTGSADASLVYASRYAAGTTVNYTLPNNILISGSGKNRIVNSDYSMGIGGTVTLSNADVVFSNTNPNSVIGIFQFMDISGGLGGTGNVYVTNSSGAGNTTVTFNTQPVNNAGRIVFNNASVLGGVSGTGTGANTISGGVGPNVTEIIQDSDTNPLVLGTGSLQTNPAGLRIANTGSALLTLSGPVTGTGLLTLDLQGAGGITVSGAISTSGGFAVNTTGSGVLSLSGGYSGSGNVQFAPASTQVISVSGALNTTGQVINRGTANSGTFYSTSGAGPGSVILSAPLGSSLSALVQDSPTTAMVLAANNSTFSKPIEIRQGPLVAAYSAGTPVGSGTIYLGTGGANASFIYAGRYGAVSGWAGADVTFANPFVVGGSGQSVVGASDFSPTFSGTFTLGNSLTIALLNANGSNMTFTGGFNGTGDVSVVNSSGSGTGAASFTTKPLNHSGALTFSNAALLGGVSGTGTTTHQISGGIGANVSAVQLLSTTNPLNISGGTITVGAVGKLISGSAALTISSPFSGSGDVTLQNNSSTALTRVSGALNFSGTLYNAGSSSSGNLATSSGTPNGSVLLTGSLRSTISRLVQDSPTSALVVYASNTGFTGPVEIRRGNLLLGNNSAQTSLLGSGTIYLGAGPDNAGLLFGWRAGIAGATTGGAAYTLANPMVVGGTGTNLLAVTDGGLTTSGPLALGGNLTLGVANNLGSSLTVNGSITGTGNVTLINSNGSNANASSIVLNGFFNPVGSVTINDAALLGGAAGNNSGAISYSFTGGVGQNVSAIQHNSIGALTISGGTVNVGISGLTLAANSGASVNVTAPVTGTGPLYLVSNGAGALNLSGAFSAAGPVEITRNSSGAVWVTNLQNVLGTLSYRGNTTTGMMIGTPLNSAKIVQSHTLSAAALTFSGAWNYGSDGELISTGAAPLTLNGAVSGTGSLTIRANGSGAISLGGGANPTGAIVNAGSGTGSVTIGGVIGANVVSLTQSSNSSLTLSANNLFTGPVNVTSGTLVLGGGSGAELGPVATSGTLNLAGGSLSFGNYTSYTVGAISGSSALRLHNASNATVALNVGNSRNLSAVYSGSLSGNGTINKLGGGNWELRGTSIFAGQGSNAGEIWFKGGTVTVTGGGLIQGLLTLAGQTGGTFTVTNGTVTMGANGNFAAGYGATGTSYVNVGSGGVLNLGAGASASGGKVFIGGGSSGGVMGNGVLTITDNGMVNVDPGSSTTPFEFVYLGGYGGNGTINLDGGTLTTARDILEGSGGGAINFNGGVLRAATSGLTLNASLLTSYVKTGGAVIDTNGFNITISKMFTAASGSPGGGLRKIGQGTLTLPVANTHTGGTTIAGGTLAINIATALGSGSLTISGGDFLNQTGTANPLPSGMAQVWSGSVGLTTPASMDTGTGSVTLAADAAVAVKSASVVVSGSVVGTGSLTKLGSGLLILAGTNSYAGATVVQSGGLVLVGPNALPASSPLTIAAGATVILQNGAPVPAYTGGGALWVASGAPGLVGAGDVSGSSGIVLSYTSSLTKVGTGSVTLTQAASFTGKTWVQSGTLSVSTLNRVTGWASASSLGAPITAANGTIDLGSLALTGRLVITGTAQTTDRILNLAGTTGGGVVDQSGTGSLLFTGSVTATGAGAKTFTLQGSTPGTGEISGSIFDNSAVNRTALLKQGTGTWTLSGSSGYSGGTTLVEGTLRIGNPGALGTGTLTLLGGVLENASSSVLSLSGVSSYVWSGSLTLSGTQGWNFGVGSIQLAANTALRILSPRVDVAGSITGNKSISIDGSGALALSGSNNIAAIQVNSGALVFSGSSAGANFPVQIEAPGFVVLESKPLPPSGLIHRWSFAESSGSVLYDSIGTAHGTIETPSGYTPNATMAGGSLRLGGGNKSTASYGSLPGSAIDGLTSMTVELWASLDAVTAWPRIFDFGDGVNSSSSFVVAFAAGSDTSRPAMRDVNYTGDVLSTSAVTTSLGTMYHWALVWDAIGQQVKLYRDGVQLCSFSNAGHTLAQVPRNAFWLGRGHFGDDTSHATYSEVRVWNRALTASELSASAVAGPELPVPALNLQTQLAGEGRMLAIGGTVVLGGTNSHSGGTTVVSGSLAVTTPTALGSGSVAVSAGAVLKLDFNGNAVITQGMSGAGALVKSGPGTVALSGSNLVSGPILVQQGSLRIDQLSAITSGSIQVSPGAALVLNPTADTTLSAVISGTVLSANPAFRVTWSGGAIGGPAPVISAVSVVNAGHWVPFSHTLTASNGPVSFSVSGLPTGLSVNSATGEISGIPQVLGEFMTSVTATNSGGSSTASFRIRVERVPVTVAVNFADNAAEALDTTTPKGPLGTVFWNATTPGAANGTKTGLVDQNNRVSPLSVGWATSNTWRGSSSTATQNGRIVLGYLDDSSGVVSQSIATQTNMTAYASGSATPIPTQGNMSGYSSVGTVYRMTVTGSSSGAVWGTDIYTYDSSIAAAAVNAGVIGVGETKDLQIKIVAGQSSYASSTRNGVTTYSWGSYLYSYSFVNPDAVYKMTVTGSNSGAVWGTNIYTYDSSIAAAAVHAGVIGVGETKDLYIRMVGGQSSYMGSSRNGVSTYGFGSYPGSFEFVNISGLYVTVSNIPYASYNVYGIVASDAGGSYTTRDFLINNSAWVFGGSSASTAPAFGNWEGAGAQWTQINPASSTRGNFWKVSGLSGSNLTISGQTSQSPIRGSLAAIVIEGNPGPAFNLQPVSQTVPAGNMVTFTANAVGGGGVSYQWRKNGDPILGATGSTLTIPNAQLLDAGVYECVASDSIGSQGSTPATLSVLVPPTFVQQPQNTSATVGGSFALSVEVDGTGPFTYSWRKQLLPGFDPTPDRQTLLRFEEPSGTVAVNSASSGDGTMMNMSSVDRVASGAAGRALSFNGANNYVRIPNNVEADFTLAAWIKTTQVFPEAEGTFGGVGLIWADVGGEADDFGLGATCSPSGVNRLSFWDGSLNGYLSGSTSINSGSWVHVAVTRSASTGMTALYVNGKLDAEGPSGIGQLRANSFIDIGGNVGDGRFFNGLMDEVQILSRALTGSEVAQLMFEFGLPEGNGPTLNVTSVMEAHSGTYGCLVTNSVGSAVSLSADVQVNRAPSILTAPSSLALLQGTSGFLSVVADGTAPLSYQWRRDGLNVAGANASTLNLLSVSSASAGTYTVTVSNAYGVATTLPVNVVVNYPPAISVQPLPLALVEGANGTLTVSASGTSPLSYQWRKDGMDLEGATGSALAIFGADLSWAGAYEVQVSNAFGSVLSLPATVSVLRPPMIEGAPSGLVLMQGASGMLSVIADGTAPLNYQWRRNGVDVPGGNSSSLYLSNAGPATAGAYTVTVSNALGEVTSYPANVVVNYPPMISVQPLSLVLIQGASGSISVTAGGTAPLSYQWRRSGVNIEGATGPVLSISSADLSWVGAYDVRVSNPFGAVFSAPANVDVLRPPVIEAAPTGLVLVQGGSGMLSVVADGTAPLNYKWQRNGLDVPGGILPTLNLSNAGPAVSGTYTVTVSNAQGEVTSSPVNVVVNYPPALVSGPQPLFLLTGSTGSMSASAIGTEPLTFTWFKNGASPVPLSSVVSAGTSSSLNFINAGSLDAGSYRVVVSNPFGSVSSPSAPLSVGLPPSIIAQPASLSVVLGGSASFAVSASGSAPLSYQWRKAGVNMPGANGPILLISNAQPAAEGSYECVVSNASGTIESGSATLTVNLPPVLVSAPVNATTVAGGTVTLSVSAQGTAPLKYQWRRNGEAIEAANSAVLQIRTAKAADESSYDCVVSNPYGSVTTPGAFVQVKLPPAIQQPPQSLSAIAGGSATFAVTATGTAPLSHQWRKNGVAIPLATAPVLLLSGIKAGDSAAYDCVITNEVSSVTSPAANLTVLFPPEIGSPALPLMELASNSVTFRVDPKGTPPFTFKWRKAGADISGATGPALVLSGSALLDLAEYDCVVGNVAGEVTSASVSVPLRITKQPAPTLFADGGKLTLSVETASSMSVGYQWLRNGLEIPGATTPVYTKQTAGASDRGVYSVKVKVGPLELQSQSAPVEFGTPQLLVNAPSVVRLMSGGSLNLSVSVLNEGTFAAFGVPLNYTWSRNGNALSAFAGKAVSVGAVSSLDAGDYSLLVSAGSIASTSAKVTVQVLDMVFNLQPVPAQALLGGSATFVAEAVGAGSVSYQWRKDGRELPGKTAPMLVIGNVEAASAGNYDVVASSAGRSVTSQFAALQVLYPPTIDNALFVSQSRSLNPQQRLELQVQAKGTLPLSYRWYKNGVLLDGATLSSYVVPSVSALDAGSYSVEAVNPYATAMSVGAARVAIRQGPPAGVVRASAVTVGGGSVNTEGGSLNCEPKAAVSLSVNLPEGAEVEGLSYQWRQNGLPISGADKAVLGLGALQSASQEGLYDVVLTNAAGRTVWSGVNVSLAVRPVQLVSDISPRTALVGSALAWSDFVAGPAESVSGYTWRKGGVVVASGSSNALVIPKLSVADSGLYSVTAANGFSSVTSGTVALTVLEPVAIAKQPVGGVFNPGQGATFTVTATGGSPRYQWLRGGVPIPGATGAGYQLASINAADDVAINPDAKLSVRVYNEDPESKRVLSSVTSEPVALTVRKPAQITSVSPVGPQLLDRGGSLILSVSATGTELSYQWRLNGEKIAGGTQSTLRLLSAGTSSIGRYDVVVKNAVNEVQSEGVDVDVKLPVSIVKQPVGFSGNAGSAVTLSVGVSGTQPVSYTWKKDGVVVQSGSVGSYAIGRLSSEEEGMYEVLVNNAVGVEARSNQVLVQLNDDVRIVEQPVSLPPVMIGGTSQAVAFRVVATSASVLRYQWRRNGESIKGANGSALKIASVGLSDAGVYDVVVSGSSGSVTSAPVELEVYDKFTVGVLPATGYPAAISSVPVRLSAKVNGGGSLSYQWLNADGQVVGDGPALDVAPQEKQATYRVRVRAQAGSTLLGVFESTPVPVGLLAPVKIDRDPMDLAVEAGQEAALEVVASGGQPLSYQWQQSRGVTWVNVGGAVSARLSLPGAKISDAGKYRVLVSNARGSETREVALAVREANVILQSPLSQTVNPGDAARFEVKAKGTSLSYQWRRNGQPLSGAVAAVYLINGVEEASAGNYDVLVTHAYGSSLSETAALTVREPVTIEAQPVGAGILSGASRTLFVKARGTGPVQYQWRKNGVAVPGANSTSLKVMEAGGYDVEVSNPCGKVISDLAVVTVVDPVVIGVQPLAAQSALQGDTVTISVQASGTPKDGETALAYQWYRVGAGGSVLRLEDGDGVSGTTGNTLLLSGVRGKVSAADYGSDGNYYVVVTGQAGSVSSLPCELSVFSAPVITQQPGNFLVRKGGATLVANFSVKVLGGGSITFDWQLGGQSVRKAVVAGVGSAGDTLSVEVDPQNVNAFKNREYSVLVSNVAGSVQSKTAKLFVLGFSSGATGAAEGEGEAKFRIIERGAAATISAPAFVAPEATRAEYRWFKGGVIIEGAVSETLSLTSVQRTDSAVYEREVAVIVDTGGGDNDGAVLYRVRQAGTRVIVDCGPEVSGLVNQKVRPGQEALFVPQVRVLDRASGEMKVYTGSDLVFELKRNGAPIAGVNAVGMFRIESAMEGDVGTYSLSASLGGVKGDAAEFGLAVGEPFAVQVGTTSGVLRPVSSSVFGLEIVQRSRMVLTASASGAQGNVSYQWRFNGVNLPGANRARFEVPSVQAVHMGRYDVVVSSAMDRVTSDIVQVSVVGAFAITSQPLAALTVNPGQEIKLSVAVNREGASYQWVKGVGRDSQVLLESALVKGVQTATLQIPAAEEADAGAYACIVRSADGKLTLTSQRSKVTVNQRVQITQQPLSLASVLVPGSGVTLTVSAKGTGPLSYQWLRNGLAIPGATSDKLKIGAVSTADAGAYRVEVRNALGAVLSDEATLKVMEPVQITAEPSDATAQAGSKPALLFSVKAVGGGELSYQWRKDGFDVSGANRPELGATKELNLFDSGFYDVVVRNKAGDKAVSQAVSRKAYLAVSGTVGTGVINAGTIRANQGETVTFRSYSEAASWSRVVGGSLIGGSLMGGMIMDVDANRSRLVSNGASLVVRNVQPVDDKSLYSAAVVKDGTLTGTIVNWMLSVRALPEVTGNPADYSVAPGGSAKFSVGVVSDAATTKFQWFYQASAEDAWVPIPDANATVYSVAKVGAGDSGNYRLEITNAAGTVSSQAARLHVFEPVKVTARVTVDGENVAMVNPGSEAVLVGDVSGDVTLGSVDRSPYQWYKYVGKVWAPVQGGTLASHTFGEVSESQEGIYRLQVKEMATGNFVYSSPVKLTVNDVVAFSASTRKSSYSVVRGDTLVLSVKATGSDVHYLWHRNGVALAGAPDAPELLLESMTGADAGVYSVLLYNEFSKAGQTAGLVKPLEMLEILPREIAAVTVKSSPIVGAVTFQTGSQIPVMQNASINEGGSFKLSVPVAAGAETPVRYQWRKDGVPFFIQGASGSISTLPATIALVVSNAAGSDSGVFDCVVGNASGSTVSIPLNLTVRTAPVIERDLENVLVSEASSANLQIVTRGSGLSYKWEIGGSSAADFSKAAVVEGSEPLITLPNVSVAMNGKYVRVTVSNEIGSVVGKAVRITVSTSSDIQISEERMSGMTVLNGGSVLLAGKTGAIWAKVKGTSALSYQWRKAGDVVGSGEVGAESAVAGIWVSRPFEGVADSTGVYDLAVTDGANFAYSVPFSVAVDPLVSGIDGPQLANPGDGVRFKVNAKSRSELTFRWFKDGVALVESAAVSGVTTNALLIANAKELDSGTYRVEIRYADPSIGGNVVSVQRVLTVATVGILEQPKSLALVQGGSGELSVQAAYATGYQWYKNGVPVSGANGSKLGVLSGSLVAGRFAGAGLYQVEVSNPGGSVLSDVAEVTVKAGLSVTLDSPGTVPVGAYLSLNPVVTGGGSVSFVWKKGGVEVSRSRQLLLSPVVASDAGVYRVEVSEGGKTAYAEVTLSVKKAPVILVPPASQVVGSGTVKLYVVARFDGALRYQWQKNGVEIAGATGSILSVNGAGVAEGGDRYTVRVSAVLDAEAYAEASARLSKASGQKESGTDVGATVSAKWWVYEASSYGRSWIGESRDASADRSGYWMVERVITGGVEKSGRSAWVWTGVGAADAWEMESVEVGEIRDSARGEYSMIGSRLKGAVLEGVLLSGRYESKSEAGAYGAPEEMVGEYEVGAGADVELSWAGAQVLRLQSASSLDAAVGILRGAQSAPAETPSGD